MRLSSLTLSPAMAPHEALTLLGELDPDATLFDPHDMWGAALIGVGEVVLVDADDPVGTETLVTFALYDADAMVELLAAASDETLADLLAQLDGETAPRFVLRSDEVGGGLEQYHGFDEVLTRSGEVEVEEADRIEGEVEVERGEEEAEEAEAEEEEEAEETEEEVEVVGEPSPDSWEDAPAPNGNAVVRLVGEVVARKGGRVVLLRLPQRGPRRGLDVRDVLLADEDGRFVSVRSPKAPSIFMRPAEPVSIAVPRRLWSSVEPGTTRALISGFWT